LSIEQERAGHFAKSRMRTQPTGYGETKPVFLFLQYLLGEKLAVERLDGVDNFTLPGQPVAIISNVTLEYRPAPPKRTPAPRRR